MALNRRDVLPMIRRALAEDRARHDVTSLGIIPASQRIQARIIAKSPGIAAGINVAMLTFAALDPSIRCRRHVHSGAKLRRGTVILTVEGRARSIFAAERTALNFLMHLSGIATLTHAYVQRVRGTRAKIFDTRKTLPGLRALEKYAVHAGGGHNHRSDLAAAILIKTNHLRALGQGAGAGGRGKALEQLQCSIVRARQMKPRSFVEVEVTNLQEFRAALSAKPHAILLDNWTLSEIQKAVRLMKPTPHAPRPTPLLEVSGGVTLANVRVIAKTGVDRISIGRLTHSAPALDVALRVI
ncbi:MAG: nicotinate-nucleotide diphosphorylase (carboxylating) [Candidatus Omnitrophica bacterium CG11_big_fil_rev_8_21_14_0_20_63_9]|nr:MAG: nicotinate-nucleotide diphosphorylase (carboxylating) [Candidatus Omnitrophica bacterium CG11_big_fil_rev_8_21_14_0_20_63_9]